MVLYKNRLFLSAGITFALIFAVLLSFRLDLYGKIKIRSTVPATLSPGAIPGKDTWMNIYQQDRKIGYSHRRFSETENGYSVQETVFMRINTMGMIQDVHLSTKGRLHRDFTLSSIDFNINSGRFSFSANGRMDGSALNVRTESADTTRRFKINLSGRTYLVAGLVHAAGAQGYKPGDRLVLDIFDPVTMSSQPVKMIFEDREDVILGGIKHSATKVLLNFKGANQLAWIDDNGEILKEKGLLGIRMERTTREDAFAQFEYASSDDLTQLASIPSNVKFETPATLKRLTVKISGVSKDGLHLNGGRQAQRNDTVTISRESVADLPTQISPETLPLLEQIFLKPEPFVQADHEKIKQQVDQVLAGIDEPLLSKAQRLVNWVYINIEKRPVLSLPDALLTLENREGDCNEHAVLLAAMARAAGIPARIETGLVYMRGRFFYHAWNSLYLGEWITADAVFNQLPADVTHIRFATGTKQQASLMGLINKVHIKVVDHSS
jgi:hypothetical protein